jgi:integrase/recombinase XerD
MEEKLVTILNEMADYLSISQMKKLQEVLINTLKEGSEEKKHISNEEYLKMFLTAKKIEGCSDRTLQYYRVTVERMIEHISTPKEGYHR